MRKPEEKAEDIRRALAVCRIAATDPATPEPLRRQYAKTVAEMEYDIDCASAAASERAEREAARSDDERRRAAWRANWCAAAGIYPGGTAGRAGAVSVPVIETASPVSVAGAESSEEGDASGGDDRDARAEEDGRSTRATLRFAVLFPLLLASAYVAGIALHDGATWAAMLAAGCGLWCVRAGFRP